MHVTDILARMRRDFIEQLPARFSSIRQAMLALNAGSGDAQQAERLHRLVHSLTGAAGTFGMPVLSEAARALEQTVAALAQRGAPPTAAEIAVLTEALAGLEAVAAREAEAAVPLQERRRVPRNVAGPPLVYVVEDDAAQAEQLRKILESGGYRVESFATLEAFRRVCERPLRPLAVIMDMVFSEGDTAGAALIAEMKGKCMDNLPVIFVSVRDDMAARLAAFRAGASRYLSKPVDSARLLRLIEELTLRTPANPFRVLLVDDDAQPLEMYSEILRQAGTAVLTETDPLRVLDAVRAFRPDVLVLDVYMPECSGPELAAIVREQDAYAYLPILFLSAERDISKQLLALDLGGDDFLVKPVPPAHLVAAVTARARRARRTAQMMETLRASLHEREQEHLALNLHAIVSMTDAAGNIIHVNDRFCEISGYRRDEFIGRNHRIVKSGVHPAEFYAGIWRTISAGETWQGEICNRRKDGSHYWVDSIIVPFLDTDGLPYQYISIRTDITALKNIEQTLRTERDFSDAVIDAMPGLFYVLAEDGRLLRANDNLTRFTGFAAEQIRQMSPLDFFAQSERERISANIREAFASGRARTEAELLTRSGGTVPFQFQATAAEMGGQRCLIGTGQDVSDLKQAQRAMQQARDIAETANRAKSEFLASMSHELRTPLNAILGFSQLFGMDARIPETSKKHALEIERAGRHLLGLVNDLIDLARIESGKLELSLEPVPLRSVMGDSLDMVAPIARKHGIELIAAGGEALGATVRADYLRLRQVIINFLSNAIKYNRPQGTVRLSCELRPGVGNGTARISVADTGPGIPAHKQARIFNAFDRLGEESGEVEGTGIGLVISRSLVEAMGGSIGFDSTEGQGSVFWAEFPLDTPAELPARAEPAPAIVPQTAGPRAHRPVVLYIEDNPMNLRLMHQIFARKKDLELRDAHTAELGIELARAAPPALILMDINLPGMDGFGALSLLKADPRTAHIPVIAVSANAMKGDRERGLKAGFVDYVAKPLDVHRFLDVVDGLLGPNARRAE